MKAAPGAAMPTQYVAAVPADQRRELAAVRDMVIAHIPAGYREEIQRGMLMWVIPLSRFPDTYNKQPLCYVALAAQKNYCSLYLMACYGDSGQLAALKQAFANAGKRLDMGKSCVHFQKATDLPLADIGKLVAAITPERWIEVYQRSRLMTKAGKAKAAKRKSARTGR